MNTILWFVFAISIIGLLWYLFVRLENLGSADWGHPGINRFAGLIRLFCIHYHRLQHDPIPLPDEGCAILASNHISGLDPLLLVAASPRPLRFLMAREEYERFGLQWLFRAVGCIPVERDGRPERALRLALRALQNGEVIVLFPHGKIQAESAPTKKLKAGAVMLARLSKCTIYPLRIEGIRGAGYTLLALPLRSRARLSCSEPLTITSSSAHDQTLEILAFAIGN
jgi:1-acyl-sn-glycerol-3-phosphate acyltransferase